jgi:hypothetical protein
MNWLSVLLALLGSLVPSADLHWVGVLTDLDHARAAAFSAGDPSLLNRVYTRDSPGRDVDSSTIKAYAGRGGRITGAELTLLSFRVLHSSKRRVQVVVIDRLAAARVVWADDSSRSLPRDLPTKHVITLVRMSAGWRID